MAKIVLRVRTWIPPKEVPLFGFDGYTVYYKGDNRSSALWNASTYRTVHAFTIDTSKSPFGLTEDKALVSPTTSYMYDQGGKLVNTQTTKETKTGLSFSKSTTADSITLNLKCSAANALVPNAPAIDYDFKITSTRAGSITLKGKHDGYPAYEVWRQIDGGNPVLVYTHNPVKTGETPLSLFGDMEKNVDEWVSYTA